MSVSTVIYIDTMDSFPLCHPNRLEEFMGVHKQGFFQGTK